MQDVFAEIKNKLNIKDVIEYYLSTHFNKISVFVRFMATRTHHFQ